ncbi:MAG: hypothetical protein UX04_C0002G0187 [Microgenomates group bacterium GW2011_GWF2_45_18]|nr:MAG: hypothetical protein UW18_C0009G0016 [Microgenomates group bacterium GW2011_GWF1_44_10]KKU02044.1 MAG: hypothetical protein UX04_C0002G0187 [Microgenomates group bacterium GW2011_GWF2_45_18]OGJ41541.1 MAG: hypothetical protein A2378_02795 [Candidatus Pacebacteria bacterium RIFOXYB1_FULL_44_10]HAU99300.1 hypothetical protein [Candidatus Paceibacterota bacterium]HAX01511.1 hypothetical protein [Candidatus Paceibacterota bacterium]
MSIILAMIFSSLFTILVVSIVLYVILSKKFTQLNDQNKPDQTLIEWIKTNQSVVQEMQKNLQDSITNSGQHVTTSLQAHTKEINDRLTRAAEVIGDLKKEAGAFTEVSKTVRDLQSFLQSPKIRGNIGEQVLNDLVGQIFPKENFFIQHRFRSGEIVDVALQTGAGIIPVDSKFPMENFQKMMSAQTDLERATFHKSFTQDVKRKITSISSKYILPEEGTVDFALMYLPSESIFYEIANSSELMESARNARVYPVSPSTLYAHLQTLLLSFEGKKIEQKTREIMKLIHAIQKDYEKTNTALSVLGKHVTNSYNTFSSVESAYSKLGQKIEMTDLLGDREEPVALPEEV